MTSSSKKAAASPFAATTAVPVERSRAEVERLLGRHGATHFGYLMAPEGPQLAFQLRGRRLRFEVPMPTRESFCPDPKCPGRRRADAQVQKLWEQSCRTRWRGVVLMLKAKLEVVDAGLTTFDAEFLAYLVTSDGRTVMQWAAPQLQLGAGGPR